MMKSARLLLSNLLPALIAMGMIGCAVFSGAAAAQPAPADTGMSSADMHGHHGAHMPGAAPSGHHDPDSGASCEDCSESVLQRIVTAPDKPLTVDIAPVAFIIPAALLLDPADAPATRPAWPPGTSPPAEPRTLTHQKISLLI